MRFKKYQHIERLGRDEVKGILDDSHVYVFPKIDGTNGCLFLGDDCELRAGSRNRVLSLDDDNHRFYATALEHPEFKAYLLKHPNHILYGEWLVKHTVRTYADDAWKKFYVFDVFELNDDEAEGGKYLPYDEYRSNVEEFEIDCIPPLQILDHPSTDAIVALLEENHYLIPDASNIGEGLVIKVYDYKNKYGRTTWAKIIAEEFFSAKEKLRSKKTVKPGEFELNLADEFITDALIKKEYAKVLNSHQNAKKAELIGRTFNAVYESFLTEDLLTVIHKNKGCTINFKTLRQCSDARIKEVLKDELF